MNKTTKIIRIILQVIVSAALLGAGFAKLTGNADEVAMFATLHLGNTVMMIIAILEIAAVIMLWFKKTRSAAILLISAIMGAAFAETITLMNGVTGEVFAPGLVLLLAWVLFAVHRCACSCSCDVCKDCVAKAK